MKRSLKLISTVVVIMIIALTLFSTACKAFDPSSIIGNVGIQANATAPETTDLTNKAGKILAYIRNIAAIAGVLLVAFLGIKYMMGSLEEKAEYKKSFIPLIVGTIVVVAATAIATTIFQIAM